MAMRMMAADDAAKRAGFVLYVLYAPGIYAPCPCVFAWTNATRPDLTIWAAHFDALHEAVDYVGEMRRRRLIDRDSRLFIRDEQGRTAWRNYDPALKRCGCGRTYDLAEFQKLPNARAWDMDEDGLWEQRDCPCSSSICFPLDARAIEVHREITKGAA